MSIDLGLMNPFRVCDHFYKAFLQNINQYSHPQRGGGTGGRYHSTETWHLERNA